MKVYKAIILKDYPDKPYASWVYSQIKTIETRMVKFKYRGDIIICMSNSSDSSWAGYALCMVRIAKVRPMKKRDQKKACIECIPGRYSYILKDWCYFNKMFKFSPYRVSGAWQNIFSIRLPKKIRLIAYEKFHGI